MTTRPAYAEVISIGTEITTGAKLDTNSQWLSLALSEVGIPVLAHTTIADELEAMVEALRMAAHRADLVLITGGLGPTLDDLTRDALAAVLGQPLVLDEPSLEHVRGMFQRRNRPMPERNVVQAMFPAGTSPLFNARGTAPGIWADMTLPTGRTVQFACMPGVPSEMKLMFQQQVLSRLKTGTHVIRRLRINCFGVGESQAEEMLGELTARGGDPDIGITVHEATITLRITALGQSIDECQAKLASARAQIEQRMGTLVFGEEDDELEHAVVRLLQARGQTVSTIEIGTGGLLAHRLTTADPAGAAFIQGLVLTPHNESADEAAALARRARGKGFADYGLAVTGWRPFDTEDPHAPPPESYVALATADGERCETLRHFGDPAIAKSRAAKAALNLLRLALLDIATPR